MSTKQIDDIKNEKDEKGEFYQFKYSPKYYYHSKIGKKLAYKKVMAYKSNYYWQEEIKNQSNTLLFD
jgi:hypothetical protein